MAVPYINISLSSGLTAYDSCVSGVLTNYSATIFGVNGTIRIGSNFTGASASDGFYSDGTTWAQVNGGGGTIVLTGTCSSVSIEYMVQDCVTGTIFPVKSFIGTISGVNTYYIEATDGYKGCVKYVGGIPSGTAKVLISNGARRDCADCITQLTCTQGNIKAGLNYYYIDCCGVETNGFATTNLIVSYNPTLPYSNSIIQIPTSGIQSCVTPTPTPTPTITATNTPTPSITPSHTPTTTPTTTPTQTPSNKPVIKPENNCDTFVSFPMGINCSVVSSITTYGGTNGALQVIITGGTSPYTISWANGNRTQTISNLPAGAYPVQVVDYYGDYTANTICYLTDPKLNCNLAGSVSQIINLPSPTPTMTQTTTPTPTMTPTPTNVVLQKMKIVATGLNSITFGSLSASTSFRITWEGTTSTTYSAGNNTPTYTYLSPYTGDIFIESLDLTTIGKLDLSIISPVLSVSVDTSELSKLSGLTNGTFGNNVVLKGLASELPRNLLYLSTQTNLLSGSTYDLPFSLTSLTINDVNKITGDTLGLPRNLTYLLIGSSNILSGDVSGLPTGLTEMHVGNNNTMSGDVSGLPRTLKIFDVQFNNTLSGNTSDLPTGMTYCQILGSNTLGGNTSGLPRTLKTATITGNNTISGDTFDLPSGLIYFDLEGNNKVGGDVANLPLTLTTLNLKGSGTSFSEIISGDVSNLPPSIVNVSIFGNNIISGDTATIPTTSQYIQIEGNNTLSAYTYPHVWATTISQVSLVGSVSNNSTYIDNILIDLTGSTWTGTKIIKLRGLSSVTATDAVTDLTSRGVTITITP